LIFNGLIRLLERSVKDVVRGQQNSKLRCKWLFKRSVEITRWWSIASLIPSTILDDASRTTIVDDGLTTTTNVLTITLNDDGIITTNVLTITLNVSTVTINDDGIVTTNDGLTSLNDDGITTTNDGLTSLNDDGIVTIIVLIVL